MMYSKQPGSDTWNVARRFYGDADRIETCEGELSATQELTTSNRNGLCETPDGTGCRGKWQEWSASANRWQDAPFFAVCPTDNPCCGLACGAHGTPTGDGVRQQCGCSCSDGYVGEGCQLAPSCNDTCRMTDGASAASANNGVCEDRSVRLAVCHANRTCDCADGTDGTDCASLRPC